MKRIFKEYKFESLAALVILLGLFLVADLSLRNSILEVLALVGETLYKLGGQVMGWLGERASAISPADYFGGILIVTAILFIIWRIRYRFKNDQRWALDFCPRCSNPIMRVHRTLWDRFLGVILFPDARRYRCVNPECSWSGLLYKHFHRRRSRSEKVARPQKTQ